MNKKTFCAGILWIISCIFCIVLGAGGFYAVKKYALDKEDAGETVEKESDKDSKTSESASEETIEPVTCASKVVSFSKKCPTTATITKPDNDSFCDKAIFANSCSDEKLEYDIADPKLSTVNEAVPFPFLNYKGNYLYVSPKKIITINSDGETVDTVHTATELESFQPGALGDGKLFFGTKVKSGQKNNDGSQNYVLLLSRIDLKSKLGAMIWRLDITVEKGRAVPQLFVHSYDMQNGRILFSIYTESKSGYKQWFYKIDENEKEEELLFEKSVDRGIESCDLGDGGVADEYGVGE